jgi:UrcA family protein
MTFTVRGALLAAGAIGLFAAGAAQADQKSVHYANSDVQTQEGAAAVYSQIRSAAFSVCEPSNLAMMRSSRQLHACVNAAVDGAVQAVDSPALTAINESRRDHSDLPAGG